MIKSRIVLLPIILLISVCSLSGCDVSSHDKWLNEICDEIEGGDYKKAEGELTWASIAFPQSYLVAYNQGYNAFAQKDYDRAIKHFKKALEINPVSANAYKFLGKSYLKKDNFAEAYRNFELSGRLYYAARDKDSEAELSKLKDQALTGSTKASGLTAYDNGCTDRKQKSYSSAIKSFSEAIDTDNKFQSAYYMRGLCYYEQGDYEKGIVDFTKAVELNPYDPTAYYYLASCYEGEKNYKEAAKYYYQAGHYRQEYGYTSKAQEYQDLGFTMQLRCNDPEAQKMRLEARKLKEQKKYNEAILILNRVIGGYPDYAAAYYTRGACYHYLGDYERAVSDYERAISLENWTGDFYYALGGALLGQKKYDEAYNNYKKSEELYAADYVYDYCKDSMDFMAQAKAKDGWSEVAKVTEEADKAFRARDYRDALEKSEKMIELYPDYYLGYAYRAEANRLLEKYSTCIADMDKAIGMNKYDYYNYATKALVYKAQGNISSAKKTYVEAAQMADFSNKITKGSEYYKRAIDLEFPEPKFNSLVSFLALFGISV